MSRDRNCLKTPYSWQLYFREVVNPQAGVQNSFTIPNRFRKFASMREPGGVS